MEQETDKLVHIIQENSILLLLIDTYFVTQNYLKSLGNYTDIAYIDDLNDFIYPVDWLINYNIYANELNYQERYKELGLLQTKFMLGCSYVPLRTEFSNITRVVRNKVSKLLITSGGTDNCNVVGNILEQLEKQSWFWDLEYYVILGRFNIYKSELEEKWTPYSNIHLLSNVNNIVDYMKLCDIAVTAGGVTTYELCASGIPSVMYTLTDNQFQIAETISRQDLIPWIGDVRKDMDVCMQKMILCLESLFEDAEKRKRLSNRMQSIVDGNGYQKLVEILLNDYKR